MKLGILICDHVQTALQEEFGDYIDMFGKAINQCDSTTVVEYFCVVDGEFPENIDVCDAYMASGSKASVNDNLLWINMLERFLWQLFLAGKPFVGICFGHQLIAKTLGGKVSRSGKGWGIGVATTIVHTHKQWMSPKINFHGESYQGEGHQRENQLKLVVSHQDQISQLPPETETLMGNDFCPHAMIQVAEHFVGLQGHPEFSRAYCYALMHTREDRIGKVNFQKGLKSLTLSVDDELMMTWLLNFLKQPPAARLALST